MTNQDKSLTKKPVLSIELKPSRRSLSLAGRGLTALSLPADLSGLYFKKAESYYRGDFVEQSYEQAFYWYKKAADLRNAEAQRRLGFMCNNALGVEKSYEQAVDWFKKAADQGDAKAQFNLGHSYYYGHGVEQSYEQANEWYKKAADQGNARAQCNLGDAYYYGEGLEVDQNKAIEFYKVSAAQHNKSAISRLKELGITI